MKSGDVITPTRGTTNPNPTISNKVPMKISKINISTFLCCLELRSAQSFFKEFKVIALYFSFPTQRFILFTASFEAHKCYFCITPYHSWAFPKNNYVR